MKLLQFDTDAEKIKYVREKLGKHQVQLAEELGYSQGSIGFYERGEYSFSRRFETAFLVYCAKHGIHIAPKKRLSRKEQLQEKKK